ncbi:hypothetical protein DZ837_15185 [Enterococcus faecalis]|nr:hypothetical protein [Enterococcus faecalis]
MITEAILKNTYIFGLPNGQFPSTDIVEAKCKNKLLEEKIGSIYRRREIDVEPVFYHLKAYFTVPTFLHFRGKQDAKIDISLILISLILRKLRKCMEKKQCQKEKGLLSYSL